LVLTWLGKTLVLEDQYFYEIEYELFLQSAVGLGFEPATEVFSVQQVTTKLSNTATAHHSLIQQ